jgi:hypothetical protein
MHCNDGLEARGFVVAELDLFVVIEFGVSKNRHFVLSLVLALEAHQTEKSVSDPTPGTQQKSEGFA